MPLGFISCCTLCKMSHDTCKVYVKGLYLLRQRVIDALNDPWNSARDYFPSVLGVGGLEPICWRSDELRIKLYTTMVSTVFIPPMSSFPRPCPTGSGRGAGHRSKTFEEL